MLNGILWVLGTGAPWRELPSKYPSYQTCHRRFQQWVRAGEFEHILRVLAEELQARGKLNLEEAFRRRWRVERLFAWLHHFRRLVIR